MMGHLSLGRWVKSNVILKALSPKFQHQIIDSTTAEFPLESGRYHLYFSYACPWAARVLLARSLLGLEEVISVSPVATEKHEDGWRFDLSGEKSDPNNHFLYLHELYAQSDNAFTGRVSVPVLYDKKTKRIVNTESEEIMRMVNGVFSKYSKVKLDLYPENLRDQIDAMNDLVFKVNLGVYKCGMAVGQQDYEEQINILFGALDRLNMILSSRMFLVGHQLTESDLRLFSTLIRFDNVYYKLFRCNKCTIKEGYQNLYRFMRMLYVKNQVQSTINMKEIVDHYFKSDFDINPNIVSKAELVRQENILENKL